MTSSPLATRPRPRGETLSEPDAPTAADAERRSVRAGAFVGRVAAWMVILIAVAVLAVGVLIPRLSGSTPYTILTGSMTPTYPPGSLIVVRPTPVDEITIGQAITYQLNSGESAVVTHRVIGTRLDEFGSREFITKGDANQAPDADPVKAVQVRGVVWYAVPKLGHVNTWATGEQRQLAVYGVAALLLGYAGTMFVRAAAGRSSVSRGGRS